MHIIKHWERESLAIDLGNNNTLVSDNNRLLLDQPSFISLNHEQKYVRAVGNEAYLMVGKTNDKFKTLKPLKGGVIADYDSASQMLKVFVKQAFSNRLLNFGFKNVISGVPYATTEVEKRAFRDALQQFKSGGTYLVYEPIAAAIGKGWDIKEPNGKMIVDIGGGLTEIAVISLSGIVSSQSLKISGDTFDEDIRDHVRRQYNMAISQQMAELIKINTGSASTDLLEPPEPYQVVGKDLLTGIPCRVVIDYVEVAEVLDRSIRRIENGIFQTLEDCPPELSSDIYVNGIHLTGGGSLLRGIKERLYERIKLPVHSDPEALLSVSKGLLKIIQDPDKYKAVLLN
jgi:rod shape-determining protein MreB and related proteins